MSCTIKCGNCSHEADFDLFTTSRLGISLPRGQIQCPSCNVAVKLVIPEGLVWQYAEPVEIAHGFALVKYSDVWFRFHAPEGTEREQELLQLIGNNK